MDSRPDRPDTGDESWLLAQLPDPDPGGSPDPSDTASLLAQLPDPDRGPGGPPASGAPEDRLDRAEATLAALAKTVARLSGTPGRLGDQRTDVLPALVGGRDGDVADDDELVEWVCWLIDRYNLAHTIPRCWAQHPALVDELDALHLGWLGTAARGRPGLDTLAWHDYLGRFLEHMRRARFCQGEHKPTPPTPPAAQTHRPGAAPATRRGGRRYPPDPPPGATT